MNDPEKANESLFPKVKIISQPEVVPVYNCVVYIKTRDDRKVVGTIANLDVPRIIGGSEREVLKLAVEQFRRIASEYVEKQEDLPLIDPRELEIGEQSRLIAVHL